MVSFFTRRALTSQTSDLIFLSKKNSKSKEQMINSHLIQIIDKLAGKEIGISAYELAKLLDLPHYKSSERAQAAYSEGIAYDCDVEQHKKAWEIWNRPPGVTNKRNFHQEMRVHQPPCKNMSFASENGFGPCCELHSKYINELETILRTQKYSIQAPYFLQPVEEYEKDFKRAPEILDYPLLDMSYDTRRNFNPRIFTCQYMSNSDRRPNTCNLFTRSFTNEGFGYSFNNGNFWDRHQKNDFNQLFYDIMFPYQSSENNGVILPETSGPAYGLNLFLMMNEYADIANGPAGRGDQSSKFFKVAIHDPMMPANLRSEGVEIEAGYLSTFLITPSEITITDAVKGLEQFRRKCRFRSETQNMTVFSEYTQAGCIFECQLRQAWERCGCIPWNYPHLGKPAQTCDYRGADCFERIMSNTETSKNCDCLFDCDSIRYSYSVSSTALDIDTLCKKNSDTEKFFGEAEYTLPKQFMRYYLQRAEDLNINTGDMCKAKMKKVAMVQFQLASQIVTQIKRDIRVTFADSISNFGEQKQEGAISTQLLL